MVFMKLIKKDRYPRRLAVMLLSFWRSEPAAALRRLAGRLLGIRIMGVGIGLFKVSLMGNGPSTALGIAVGDQVGIDFSICIIVLNCLYFVVELLFARDMVGVGTLVNWFLVGPIASFFEKLFVGAFGHPQNFPQQLGILAVGVLILSFSCALYQTADVGIAPYDSLSLLLARKLPVPYFCCRVVTGGVCVVLALLPGGLVGLGTLVCALALGPFVAFFTRYAAEAMVFGRAAARARRETSP